MKQLTVALFRSLVYATLIIAASILFFSCSKDNDALVVEPSTESSVVFELDGKEYTYKGVQVGTTIAPTSWHNLMCTQNNNNTVSFGFRATELVADSLYILGTKDMLLTFKAGAVTYSSDNNGYGAVHITGKANGKVTGYFDVPVTNNVNGTHMRAVGRMYNVKF